MISQIHGKVVELNLNSATILLGGFGVEVNLPLRSAANLVVGQEVSLFTNLVPREDSLTLYGFESTIDRELFKLLQTVTGVGPKVALSALAIFEAESIYQALANKDEALLEKIPGFGKKSVARLILELSDKAKQAINGDALSSANNIKSASVTLSEKEEQVIAGLVNLGFNSKIAGETVKRIVSQSPELDLGSVLKAALKDLAK
jgi:Holliday junction DNA helicase RuvA